MKWARVLARARLSVSTEIEHRSRKWSASSEDPRTSIYRSPLSLPRGRATDLHRLPATDYDRAGGDMKRCAIGLTALVVWLGCIASPASATFPGANGRIVFLRGFPPQVYTMEPDGSDVEQLTSFARATTFDPAWSPGGGTIAFVKVPHTDHPSAIWTMSADGSNQTRLHGERWFFYENPSYTPDGSTIVFSRCYPDFSRCDLQTMDADGTGVATLTPFGIEVYDLSPQYSPDGTQIAFASFNRDGVTGAVYVMDADGSNIRRVTPANLGSFTPDWAPDGSRIAFTTHCCDPRSSAVYAVDPDGSNLTQLTDPGDSHDFSPSWSPAGDAIVFERDTPDFGRFDTWIMSPDGSGATLLKKNAFEAVWGRREGPPAARRRGLP